MAVLSLGQTALGACHVVLDLLCRMADFVVGSLESCRQGEVDMVGNALDFGEALISDFVYEGP